MTTYTAREAVHLTGTEIVLELGSDVLATYKSRLPFDDFVAACAKRGDRLFFADAEGRGRYLAGDLSDLLET